MAGADIVDRDKPGARAFFAPGADPAEMVDIAQADDGDPRARAFRPSSIACWPITWP